MGKAPGRTHVYYSGTPQWAFGAGLSYAQTELSAAHGKAKAAGAPPTIEVAVRNLDAKRATDEVVFLFLVPAAGTVPPSEPAAKMRRTLVAFERVTIAPRGAAAVHFDVRAEAAQLRDAAAFDDCSSWIRIRVGLQRGMRARSAPGRGVPRACRGCARGWDAIWDGAS